MTTGLPDRRRPERRKQILPEGVIRAKDNADDFSHVAKSRQSEAEHNMGYYLAELNNRNIELEDEVERQDKELKAQRVELAELRRKAHQEKQVFAVDPAALPDADLHGRIHRQRMLLEQKDRMIKGQDGQLLNAREALALAQKERDENWTRAAAAVSQREHWKAQAEHHESQYHIMASHRTACAIAAAAFGLAWVITCIIGG